MSEWEIVEDSKNNAIIKVIGVGGGGGNACLLYTSDAADE